MTTTKGASEKPTKPPSGYNIFYQSESKRARDRENARKLYLGRSSFVKAEHRQVANKTRFIGGSGKAWHNNHGKYLYFEGRMNLTCTMSTKCCGQRLTSFLLNTSFQDWRTRCKTCIRNHQAATKRDCSLVPLLEWQTSHIANS